MALIPTFEDEEKRRLEAQAKAAVVASECMILRAWKTRKHDPVYNSAGMLMSPFLFDSLQTKLPKQSRTGDNHE